MIKRFKGHIKKITETMTIVDFYMDNQGHWWLLTDDNNEKSVPKLRRIYERKGGQEYIVIDKKRIYASSLEGLYGNEGQLSIPGLTA